MALWAKSQTLTDDALRHMQSLYGHHFPIEVRHILAEWIEEQKWYDLDEEMSCAEDMARQILNEMIQLINQRSNGLSGDMFVYKLKLQEQALHLQEVYSNNPLELIRVVKKCLNTEKTLVEQCEQGGSLVLNGITAQAEKERQIAAKFDFLHKCTQETDSDLRNSQHEQETFILKYQDSAKVKAQLDQFEMEIQGTANAQKVEHYNQMKKRKEAMDKELGNLAQKILRLRLTLADKHNETFHHLSALQTQITDQELIDWKRQQQLAGNGASFDANLDLLQKWCEGLAEIISKNRQQIKKVELLRAQLPIEVPPPHIDLLPTLNTTITGLLSSLVTSTFIIEKQPPQVLKKESRFSATVRLLVGGQLNVHMNPPQVKATLISESQAKSLLKNDKNLKAEMSGDILNNQGTMEYQQPTGTLSVNFRNMQLKRVKRGDRRGNECVMEEKFSVLFQSNFSVGGGELVFQVWTLSLPVVVTVHGNQECNALATVLWDNQFAESGRVPFTVPESVTWPQLADMLNYKFTSATGRPLTHDNLNYLASKLFQGQPNQSFTSCVASWTTFYKDTLPGRTFTFWEWFYAILKLTREHLKGPWCDGLIIGFISKNDTEAKLSQQCGGTFLLRYSDSMLGGITIGWVTDASGSRQVWNLAPFSSKDFVIRSLADRIQDLPQLVYLHPTMAPKADTFGKYWTKSQEDNPKVVDGYIGTELVTRLPGMETNTSSAQQMTYENPQTPIHNPASPSGGFVNSPGYATSDMGPDNPNDMDLESIGNLTDYNMPDDIITGEALNQLIQNVGGGFNFDQPDDPNSQ